MNNDEYYIEKTLELAKIAYKIGEIPVGAIIVWDDKIVGQGFNKRELLQNPLKHAEMLAIEEAAKVLGRWRLFDCTIYVSLEPCPMCLAAIKEARIKHLVFGAKRPNDLYIKQVLKEPCKELIVKFFKDLRLK